MHGGRRGIARLSFWLTVCAAWCCDGIGVVKDVFVVLSRWLQCHYFGRRDFGVGFCT